MEVPHEWKSIHSVPLQPSQVDVRDVRRWSVVVNNVSGVHEEAGIQFGHLRIDLLAILLVVTGRPSLTGDNRKRYASRFVDAWSRVELASDVNAG